MRKYINLIESIESADDIIPGEDPAYDTLAKQLDAVQRWPMDFQQIKNPSEQVQLAAVQQYGWAINYILDKGITPSIPVQKDAVLQNPVWALKGMIKHNFLISKMVQWTAAKRIKEQNLRIDEYVLDKLDPDVQKYLRSNKI